MSTHTTESTQTDPAVARTPRQDGFVMPGRWVEHERTFVSWPCCEWPAAPGHLQDARDEWAEVIRTISRFEPVTVIANPGSPRPGARGCAASSVDVAEIPIDDCWIRDNGPIFVDRLRRRRGDDPLRLQRLGRQGAVVGQRRGCRQAAGRAAGHARYAAPIIAEGGGITSDGEGTVITTESVLLNPNRNPGLGKAEIEAVLRDYLGAEKVIWLPFGLAEDSGDAGTDGHSDNVSSSSGRVWRCSRRRPTGRTRTGNSPRRTARALAGADRRAGTADRGGRDRAPVLHPRARGRAAGGAVHQLLPGQRRHHRAAAGRPRGRRRLPAAGRPVPRPRGGQRAHRLPGLRWRRDRLHHPAAAGRPRVAPAGDHA